MKFIELTRKDIGTKVLINIANIVSIFPVIISGVETICVVQEVTSVDNLWEVTETYEEIVGMINKRGRGK